MSHAVSDLNYVKCLTGPVKEIVVASYVKSFEYTHGENKPHLENDDAYIL